MSKCLQTVDWYCVSANMNRYVVLFYLDTQ